MIQKLINRLSFLSLEVLYTRRLLEKMFNNKSVALVGGAAEIFDHEYGAEIDTHDIVVHFNLMNINGKENFYGSRTDVRFIGATLSNKHISFLPAVTRSPIVITNFKNRNFLKKLDLHPFFYSAFAPKNSFKNIDKLINSDFSKYEIHPPRSGLFFLIQILTYGRPSKVSLFGISKSADKGIKFVSYADGKIKEYEEASLAKNHCSPKTEVEIIRKLEDMQIIKVYSD